MGDQPPRPFPVIVGVPRSGTTLLRFMLDAHPDIAIPPETGFLSELARLSGERSPDPGALVALMTDYPPGAPAWPDFGVDDLEAALQAFRDRERKFGAISE